MNIGIMQPYFFPYIGYWQLINTVDTFVVYDDVNFINKGWINRNNILVNNISHLISVPLVGASQFKLINEIDIVHDRRTFEKILKTITISYKKAPYFNDVIGIVENFFLNDEKKISKRLKDSIIEVCNYLDIKNKIVLSSNISLNDDFKGQDRIINIVKALNGSIYTNPIGGKLLYDRIFFKKLGIELKFIKSKEIKYSQFKNDFVPSLSIIDVMMFNSKDDINFFLNECTME